MAEAEHSTTLSTMTTPPMTIHMYPLTPTAFPTRQKRRQVKVACTNCQRACKKCDDARPCLRCVKYGISDECVDSQRKERRKGVKRGPYRKRDAKGNSSANATTTASPQDTTQPVEQYTLHDPSTVASSSTMPFVTAPVTYHGAIYNPFVHPSAPSSMHKPGDSSGYPQPHFYIAPQPVYPQQDANQSSYHHQPPSFYPASFIPPYPQSYHASPYLIQPRPETQFAIQYPHPYTRSPPES
ncbi:hypothetical protein WG66_006162 [Moniliophthora roreri]|nr:hypothetical protein WG66_006162 [Moniliophthora roreri]